MAVAEIHAVNHRDGSQEDAEVRAVDGPVTATASVGSSLTIVLRFGSSLESPSGHSQICFSRCLEWMTYTTHPRRRLVTWEHEPCSSPHETTTQPVSPLARGKLLNVLQIPMSEITDQAMEKHAKCLPVLKVLDISNCLNITPTGIEALGPHCKLLVQLKRNMPPPDLPQGFNRAANKVVEEEALAVANTMPMLEQLELAYGLFSDLGLNAILTKCQHLRTLDILGCWNVRLEIDMEERCCALQSFREPWEPEYSMDSSSGGDYEIDDTDSDD